MNSTAQQFTAAQIAEALGKSVRVVRRWLGVVKPDGSIVVRGMLTATWRVESLPVFVQQQLKSSAQRRGFAGVSELLSGDTQAKPCPIPWNEICPEQQSEAIKLQRALLPALEHWKEITASPSAQSYTWRNDATLLSIGLSVYEKEFGAKLSAERWQYLFNRVLERDRGAAQFHNLELFLSGNPRRAPSTPSEAESREFPALHDLIFNKFSDPQNSSSAERARLWQCVYQHFRPLSGRELKQARLSLLKYLWTVAPWLAASQNALRVALDRFTARGNQCNGAIEAFADGREERRGIPTAEPYEESQVNLIKFTAARFTGNSRAMAVRKLNEQGLITDPRLKQSLDRTTSKTYLPASLRARLKDVPAWNVVSLGDSAAAKLVPPMKLNYEGIPSMLCLVPDDRTPDFYAAIPDGKGWWDVVRPQIIFITDYRSYRILGRGIVPAPQFTALDVWAPFTRVFMKYGTPPFILREGGKIFRGSKLVNSMSAIGERTPVEGQRGPRKRLGSFSVAEIECALERSGVAICGNVEQVCERLNGGAIQFREAYSARAKDAVEGIMRLIAKEEQFLPCYCGNDERTNLPKRTKEAIEAVRSRRATPAEVGMLEWGTQLEGAIDKIISIVNSTPQEGRKLRNPLTGSPMSPNEAFEVFTNKTDPPNNPFSPETAMYMAALHVEVEVKKPNIRRRNFNCGFVEVMGNTYCNEETGARIGQKLLAHYHPEIPEICIFSDMNLRNPFSVARLESSNALFPDEQTRISISQARRAVSGLKASYKAAEATFEPVIRQALVAPLVKDLNEKIETEVAAVKQRERRRTERAGNIAKLANGIGIRPSQVENSERSQRALEGIRAFKLKRQQEKREGKTYMLDPEKVSTPTKGDQP